MSHHEGAAIDRPTRSWLRSLDTAIVHDYLNQIGGAERVVLELCDMWPAAPVYTSLYRKQSTLPGFEGRDVRTTMLDRLPVDGGFRNLFPLYPAAFRMLGEIEADLVLASSSGWAHMARVRSGAFHAVYCHTPARWLYRPDHLGGIGRRSIRQALVRPALRALQRLDREAAWRAHLYIANSENVRRRIKSVYGIDAVVVPPPVEVGRFRATPRGERLLSVSRLIPYKHVDLVVRAASRVGIGLDVLGDGPMMAALRNIAGPTVTLHGAVSDDVVIEMMEACRAVCVPAEEDFGLVAVEAHAAGKPVIAYGRGGALETVDEGFSGVFFRERTEDSLIGAIAASEAVTTPPERIAERAKRFSRAAFRERLSRVLQEAMHGGAAFGGRSDSAGHGAGDRGSACR